MRREYKISKLNINGRSIEKVIIDPHVDKHSDHITDELILDIIGSLDGEKFLPTGIEDDFSYFATKVRFNNCWYKLVWLLEEGELYIGVITLFKDRRLK